MRELLSYVSSAALRSRAARYADAFSRAGVHLIVVLDGVVQPEKFPLWLSRRRKECASVRKLNAAMHGGETERKRRLWLPPAWSQSYLGRAFRDAGCRVVFSTVEGDRAVAGLASSLPGCLGVIGKDSDFFVLPLPASQRYYDFSTLRLNARGISAVAYSQADVCKALELPLSSMPMLAAMLGFDLHDRLSSLQDVLKLQPGAVAVEVAATMLRKRLALHASPPPTPRELRAAEFYTPVAPEDADGEVLRPHVSVLCSNRTFVGPLCCEDVRSKAPVATVYEATAALRAAVYARLFASDARSGAVDELCCSALRDTAWPKAQLSFAETHPAAHPRDVAAASPNLAPAQALAAHVVTNWLAPHLSSAQARALVEQSDPGLRRTAAVGHTRLRSLRPTDAHAASLFLVAMDTFCFGCDGEAFDPPVWDIFHGPLFHSLCRGEVAKNDARNYLSSAIRRGAVPPAPAPGAFKGKGRRGGEKVAVVVAARLLC